MRVRAICSIIDRYITRLGGAGRMIRAIDILNLPSMREGYIAAGGNGAYRVIRRFEILEETYPAVVSIWMRGFFI